MANRAENSVEIDTEIVVDRPSPVWLCERPLTSSSWNTEGDTIYAAQEQPHKNLNKQGFRLKKCKRAPKKFQH